MIASQDVEALSARPGLRPDVASARRGRTRAAATRAVSTGALVTARQSLAALVTLLTGITVARCLGPTQFGVLAGGVAAFALGLGLANAGFGIVLVRELAAHPQDDVRLTSVALRGQLLWSATLAVLLAAGGVGAGGTRGRVMVVLAPALALGGVAVTRQIAAVRRRAPQLLILDLAVMLLVCGSTFALAVRHASVVTIAANLSAWTCIAALPAIVLAWRRSAPAGARAGLGGAVAFARTAVPIGVAATAGSIALLLALTVLSASVPAPEAGAFAIGLAFVLFVVAVAGACLVARARGFVGSDGSPAEQTRIAAALTRVVVCAAVPLAALVAAAARPIVQKLLGSAYLGAVPIIHALMVATVLGSAAAAAGIVAISAGRARRQLVAGLVGTVGGAVGVAVLAGGHGPVDAAWVVAASQATIAAGAVVSLRGALGLRGVVRGVWRGVPPGVPSDRHRGAIALAAAGAAGASLPGLHGDPSGATAAAAALLGGRISARPQIGEARRPTSDQRSAQRLALGVVAIAALALVAVAAANLRDLPGEGAAPTAHVAGDASFTFRYASPWGVAQASGDGDAATDFSGTGSQAPVELVAGAATLSAGTLARSAEIPGGAPPALVRALGVPAGRAAATIGGHPASRYAWEPPGHSLVVAYVVPTDAVDLAIVCSAPAAPALSNCQQLALAARLGRGVLTVVPGRPVALSKAVATVLSPAAGARRRMAGLAQPTFSARATPASDAAAADRAAATKLAKLLAPQRDRGVIDAVTTALGAESSELAAIAGAARDGNRGAYTAAAAGAQTASLQLHLAAARLAVAGIAVPALPPLTITAPPAVKVKAPARTHRAASRKRTPPRAHGTAAARHRSSTSTPASSHRSSTGSAGHVAPVEHTVAPVVHTTAPVVHSTAPVVHSTAPVVHSTAPVVHSTPPVTHSTTPAHHATTPPVTKSPTTKSGTSTHTTTPPPSHSTSTHATTPAPPPTHSTSGQTSTPAPTVVVTPTSTKHSSGSSHVVVVPTG